MRPIPLHHSLRGIAALWIALSHLIFNPIYSAGFGDYRDFGPFALLIRFDFLAVDFFFVMSGCLLTLSYRTLFEKKTTGGRTIDKFYLLRLARIYPLHVISLALIFATASYGIDWPKTAGHWQFLWEHKISSGTANLALMHGWGIIPAAAWNEPAWTISIFALLYILFPNLVYLTRNIPDRYSIDIIMGILLLYALQRHVLPMGGQSDGVGAIIRGFSFFLTGMFTARLQQRKWQIKWNWKRIFYGIVGGTVALVGLWSRYPFDMVVFHLLYPFLMLAGLRVNLPRLSTAPFRWAGSRAYAIYMFHYPVMVLAGLTALPDFAHSGMIEKITCYFIIFIILAIVSELAFRFIERPFYGVVKRRITLP